MTWDVVIDTWRGAPKIVELSASMLADKVGRAVLVSSRSVHTWPLQAGADEYAPVVPASPGMETTTYGADKRGAEIAFSQHFSDRCLLLRPGLLLGPGEYEGRLAFWLRRIAAGGDVLAPGPQSTPLQYLDVRDLALWAMSATVADELKGPVNVATRTGALTIGELLDACTSVTGSNSRLRWVDGLTLARAGLMGWTDLPIWSPPGTSQHDALHCGNVELAHAYGLSARPFENTVADTWAWLRSDPRVDQLGYSSKQEQTILASLSPS